MRSCLSHAFNGLEKGNLSHVCFFGTGILSNYSTWGLFLRLLLQGLGDLVSRVIIRATLVTTTYITPNRVLLTLLTKFRDPPSSECACGSLSILVSLYVGCHFGDAGNTEAYFTEANLKPWRSAPLHEKWRPKINLNCRPNHWVSKTLNPTSSNPTPVTVQGSHKSPMKESNSALVMRQVLRGHKGLGQCGFIRV